MSIPGMPPNPYGQPPQGAPAGYPRPAAPTAPDRATVRQVAFGAGIVVGIAAVSNVLSLIGNSVFGFSGEFFVTLIWSVFVAAVFAACAGISALFIAPVARATSTADLVKRLALAAGVGAAVLFVLNFVWAVLNGGQYLAQVIVSSGILGSISTAISYGAYFTLGVLLARALPVPARAQTDVAGQAAGHATLEPQAQAFAWAQGQAYAAPEGSAATPAPADQSEPQGFAGSRARNEQRDRAR